MKRSGRPLDSAPDRILAFNEGRDPEHLRLKYKAMAKSPLAFLRGTCHLFWEDWPAGHPLDVTPLAWSTGDLHLENFGAFKGDNRLEYFDINDFDEAALAPCIRDPVRCACSVLVAARETSLSAHEGRALCAAFLDAYAAALRDGRIRWVERDSAEGEVRKLLKDVAQRTRIALLRKRTETRRSGRRRIRTDGEYALPATRPERAWAASLARRAARKTEQASFRVVDVARRVAGTGSLGVERYVVLVEGKGPPDGHRLIDLKAAHSSAMAAASLVRRVSWVSEAERVVWAQTHMQAASPALLRAVTVGRQSYVLRELQPREDRLLLRNLGRRALDRSVRTMGGLVAWAQLRAAGRRGAASPELLIEYAHEAKWTRVLDYAAWYARVIYRNHREFRTARRDGFFDRQFIGADRREEQAARRLPMR